MNTCSLHQCYINYTTSRSHDDEIKYGTDVRRIDDETSNETTLLAGGNDIWSSLIHGEPQPNVRCHEQLTAISLQDSRMTHRTKDPRIQTLHER
ncbi:hypothetical protein DBV15_07486 [Temnothorax longispinosus]|uniref:Uncharacterized protein n=1 Tax=Temnothorax longispinosus TaxID=300112 RepID=A0A4S2KIM4_9HYME|nr:hypothetical protein DBV15_07486 [Temnothorax longispinosus]